MKIRQLKHKEKVLLEKKDTGKLQNYNVMKNVSTHSMVNVNDGELEMRLEMDDISVYVSKNQDKNRNPARSNA